jgi:ankyrin repeat protein
LGADVNSPGSDLPPICGAIEIWGGEGEIAAAWVDRMLQSGADPNVKANVYPFGWGLAPLHMLSTTWVEDPTKIIKLLLSAGASVDIPANDPDGAFPYFEGATPLMLALGMPHLPERGGSSLAPLLLDRGASVTVTDAHGRSALFWACYCESPDSNDLQTFSRLLDAGAVVDAPDKSGRTPLMIATRARSHYVPTLLKAGANPKAIDKMGRTFLMHTARGNVRWERPFDFYNTFPLTDALEIDPDVQLRDVRKRSAFFYTAVLRIFEREAVEKMISLGADVNEKDYRGRTPIMYLLAAQTYDHQALEDRIRLLLDSEADLTVKDVQGNTAIHHAIAASSLAVLYDREAFFEWRRREYRDDYDWFEGAEDAPLLNCEPRWSDLRDSSFRETIIRMLLASYGGDTGIDDRNACSQTPLLLLTEGVPFDESALNVLKILVARRVDVSATDEDGMSPLMNLCHRKFEAKYAVEAAETLLSQSADVNARNNKGETALDIAQKADFPEMVAVLRKYGALPGAGASSDLPEISSNLRFSRSNGDENDEWNSFFDELYKNTIFSSAEDSAASDEILTQSHPIGDGGEHPKAAQLHPEALELYRRANTLYQADGDRKYPHIVLESGKRTVAKQVDLYRDFIEFRECGGPKANPANHPGKSWPHYGLAIDVVRGGDSNRLLKALEGADWIASVEDEGWHFEAQIVPAFGRIRENIESVIGNPSKSLAQKIVDFVLYGCYLSRNEARYRQQEREIRENERTLRDEKSELDRRRAELNVRGTKIRDEDRYIQDEQRSIDEVRRRYDSMVYDRCPNRHPYETCNHDDLKRRWREERQELWNDYQRRSNFLSERKRVNQRAKLIWNEDDRKCRGDLNEWNRKRRDFQLKKDDFLRFDRQMKFWRREMQQAELFIRRKTPELQSLVESLSNQTT